MVWFLFKKFKGKVGCGYGAEFEVWDYIVFLLIMGYKWFLGISGGRGVGLLEV